MENDFSQGYIQTDGQYAPPPAPRASGAKTAAVVIGTIVGYLVISGLSGVLITGLLKFKPSNDYQTQFLGSIPVFLFLFVMLYFALGKKKAVTMKGNGFLKGLMTGGYLVVAGIINFLSGMFTHVNDKGVPEYGMPESMHFGSLQVWCIAALILSAGICEELMFRGIILNALRDFFGRDTFKGTALAIFISGAMFGCLHFINLLAGVSLLNVIIQVVSVIGMGFFFGAVYCRCGNLKVTMFIHALVDICILIPQSMQTHSADLGQSINDSINPAALVSIITYTAITLFLLRKEVRGQLFTYTVE